MQYNLQCHCQHYSHHHQHQHQHHNSPPATQHPCASQVWPPTNTMASSPSTSHQTPSHCHHSTPQLTSYYAMGENQLPSHPKVKAPKTPETKGFYNKIHTPSPRTNAGSDTTHSQPQTCHGTTGCTPMTLYAFSACPGWQISTGVEGCLPALWFHRWGRSSTWSLGLAPGRCFGWPCVRGFIRTCPCSWSPGGRLWFGFVRWRGVGGARSPVRLFWLVLELCWAPPGFVAVRNLCVGGFSGCSKINGVNS